MLDPRPGRRAGGLLLGACATLLVPAAAAQPAPCPEGGLLAGLQAGAPHPLCGTSATVCLPLAEAFAGEVDVDGSPAGLVPCGYDTLDAYALADLPTVGMSGPFEVVWRRGAAVARARLDAADELLGFLRANDAGASWRLVTRPDGDVLAGRRDPAHGSLTLIESGTGLRREALPGSVAAARGRALELPPGRHLVRVSRGDCVDSVDLRIACARLTVREVTAIEDVTGVVCLGGDDARDDRYRILSSSQANARVDASPEVGCVEVTGLVAGAAEVDVEVCDAARVSCRRVRLAIEVLPRSAVAPPDARRDVVGVALNGQRTFDPAANDAIVGGVTDVHLRGDSRGRVRVDDQFRVHYSAPPNWCGRERIGYEVCSPGGCDTSSILVEVVCEEIVVFDGVSPNGDGINDHFTVLGLEGRPRNALTIFNRGGQRVFAAEGYANDWPGDHHDPPLPPGTYFYVLEVAGLEPRGGYLQLER